MAGGLLALSCVPGARVAIVLPTGPDFFDAFFGCVLAGLVPVPMYPPVRLGRMQEYHQRTAAMVGACGARVVVTDSRIHRLLGPVVELARPMLGCRSVDSIRRFDRVPAPLDRDAPAFIQFSSGTTAAPKPVALSHRQILANVVALTAPMLRAWPEAVHGPHSAASWLPLYHDMGLVGGVLTAMAHPVDLTLLPPELFVARPASWLRAISRWRATISPAPNFAYALCVDRVRDEELADLDLSSWLVALNGAEPVSPTVLERFVERFAGCGLRGEALTPVYGLAEATLAVTFSDVRRRFRVQRFERQTLTEVGLAVPDDDGHPLVSAGRPLEGFRVRIVNDSGLALADGCVGHVLVSGPSVMRGYHDDPQATAEAIDNGWLRTGDTGFIHDGELFLYGRAKDILIVRGRNHAPQDIEQSLDGLPGLRAGCSAAVGVAGDDGERLVVLIERSATAPPTDDELRAAARSRVVEATGLVPDAVEVLAPGTLPRTSSGKIRRDECRRRWAAGSLAPPAPVNPVRIAGAMLASRLAYARAARTR